MFNKLFKKYITKKESKLDYENELIKKFGETNVDNKKLNIRLMFISDTHNCLANNKELIEEIKTQGNNFDACILLGDHSGNDLLEIKNLIPTEKLFGIVGNHDSWKKLEEYGITDIDKKVISINGVKIAGIAGSSKYKDGDYGMYTQDESLEIAEKLSKADILITHDKPYLKNENNLVHSGLKGITYYIYKNKVPIHIHGHLHQDSYSVLKNGTSSICIYQFKVLDL